MTVTKAITVPDPREGRIVTFLGSSDDMDNLKERVGFEQFTTAVGYLTTWSLSYPQVTLFFNVRDLEITATYYNTLSELQYCIGAVFNTSTMKFGFHS
jgi:hypothetical protein